MTLGPSRQASATTRCTSSASLEHCSSRQQPLQRECCTRSPTVPTPPLAEGNLQPPCRLTVIIPDGSYSEDPAGNRGVS